MYHVSDDHFGEEDPAALGWFAACVAAEKPDAVVMTGDLTMRARRHEFDAGARWLQGLGVPVTVEPGNHDVPYYFDPPGGCSTRTGATRPWSGCSNARSPCRA